MSDFKPASFASTGKLQRQTNNTKPQASVNNFLNSTRLPPNDSLVGWAGFPAHAVWITSHYQHGQTRAQGTSCPSYDAHCFRNVAGLIVQLCSLAISIIRGALKPSGKITHPHRRGESSATYLFASSSPVRIGIFPE